MRERTVTALLLISLALVAGCATTASGPDETRPKNDPYAEYVWPPPPDEARIRLVDILSQRSDVEAEGRLSKTLMGARPQSGFERLRRPVAVAMDDRGRIYVTDVELHALFRFDRTGRRMDIFGTTGGLTLQTPLGVTVGSDGLLYVADAGLAKIVVFDQEGAVVGAFGASGELKNPTDAELSPDGTLLYVADSKAHEIVVFDKKSSGIVNRFGARGGGEGQFNFPTSLSFDKDGSLFVVDQLNSRVQILGPDGEYLDSFGNLGTGFGQFVRPKDVTIDDDRLIYVTDAAFNNVQIFDSDLRLLTFVGGGGTGPGQFQISGGVATSGSEFAVVDQLGRRVQVFRFLEAQDQR